MGKRSKRRVGMMHQKILVQKKAVLEQLKSKAAVRDIENNKTVEVSLPSYIKCKWTHLSVGSCCRGIEELWHML